MCFLGPWRANALHWSGSAAARFPRCRRGRAWWPREGQTLADPCHGVIYGSHLWSGDPTVPRSKNPSRALVICAPTERIWFVSSSLDDSRWVSAPCGGAGTTVLALIQEGG